MKKIFFIFLLFFFGIYSVSAECKYKAKFDKCVSALEAFTGKKINLNNIGVGGSLKDFKEFPCIQAGEEGIYFQIAMDENFKKVDKELDEYLKNLYENKDFYFGKSKKFDYFSGIEHIFLKKDEFKKKYDSACLKSLEEVAECSQQNGEKSKFQGTVSVLGALDFISGASSSGACFGLGNLKSNIFLEIAYNGLLLNSQQVSKDALKLETQEERENYGKLLEAMRLNQSYMERLNSRWTSKTKYTLGD